MDTSKSSHRGTPEVEYVAVKHGKKLIVAKALAVVGVY